ncbi:MAG: cytochrome b561 domain-containing protein [Pseudomonadota bacterium]
MEWLFSPIDPSRAHEVGAAISWHGRMMVLAWGILAPLAVLVARFFKILPGQDWPRELDSHVWWRSHWIGQSAVAVLTVGGLILVWLNGRGPISLHTALGYAIVLLLLAQVLLGLLRGSKGGPTAPARDGSLRGHHYDMTPWRRAFEALHKSLGYGLLGLAVVALLSGLWKANAPVWMWAAIGFWWAALALAFWALQKRGMAVDTYQAIWGDDPSHPGNRRPAPGWGVRRPGDILTEGRNDVRNDRGHRVRSH